MMRRISCVFWFVLLAIAVSPVCAKDAALEGTLWMYEHESGFKHYVAFYGNYHYVNSSFSDAFNDDLWLRSAFPYLSHENYDGSIIYCSTHVAAAAWAINWGRLNLDMSSGSFNAAGMLFSIFIYNRNEPYHLLSAEWSPPAAPAGGSPSIHSAFIAAFLPVLFGR